MTAETPLQKTVRILSPYSSLIGLLFVVALFALSPKSQSSFLTLYSAQTILTQTVVVAIGAIGMTLIIVGGGIDLSVGSTVALSGVTAAALLRAGVPPLAALVAALGVGVLVGLVNGSLISRFRITPFIVTLGMLGIARGLAKWVAGNEQVYFPGETSVGALMRPGTGVLGLPGLPDVSFLSHLPKLSAGAWLTVVLAVLTAVVMRRTVFGRRVYALGSNEQTARVCGVNVPLQKTLIYSLGGFFFGLAGFLQMARLTSGDPTAGMGLELDVIAAVIIGGASLAGGSGGIFGSMVGALMMAVLRYGCTQMEWPTYIQEIAIGLVIIIAVSLDRLRRRQA